MSLGTDRGGETDPQVQELLRNPWHHQKLLGVRAEESLQEIKPLLLYVQEVIFKGIYIVQNTMVGGCRRKKTKNEDLVGKN